MKASIVTLKHNKLIGTLSLQWKFFFVLSAFALFVLVPPCQAEDERDIRYFRFFEEGYSPEIADRLQRRKHWGFIDESGKFVIAPTYDQVRPFIGEWTYVLIDEKGWRIDRSGKALTSPKPRFEIYAEINKARWDKEAQEKRQAEATKYKGDILDSTGKIPIGPASAFELSVFSEGLASCHVPENLLSRFPNESPKSTGNISSHGYKISSLSADRNLNSSGFIDNLGRMVIPPNFYQVNDFKDGIASVDIWNSALQPDAQKAGYIDKEGQLIGGKFFDVAWPFENGFGIISKNRSDGPGSEMGFIGRNGQQIMSGYAEVNNFQNGIAAVKVPSGKWGFVDITGRMVIQPQFDWVDYRSGAGLVCVEQFGHAGYMDKHGKLAIPCVFAAAGVFSNGLAAAALAATESEKLSLLRNNIDEHCGFISRTGDQAVAPKYIGARQFSEGLCAVRKDFAWGYIDVNGREIISPRFDDARQFSEGLAAVRKGDLWGFIDRSGKYVIEPMFPVWDRGSERIPSPKGFSGGLALVCFPDQEWHFINREGHEAFRMHFAGGPSNTGLAKPFSEGLAVMADKDFGSYGFVDGTGKLQIPHKFTEAEPFSEGLAAVYYSPKPFKTTQIPAPFNFPPPPDSSIPAKWGYIDKTGKLILQPRFDQCGPFKSGIARVGMQSRSPAPSNSGANQSLKVVREVTYDWQFIDRYGHTLGTKQFEDARDFSDGYAAVCKGHQWGFVDKSGAFAINPKYELALDFHEGLAAVKVAGKWGFINTAGKMVIPARYWRCLSFSNGRALVLVPGNKPPVSTNATWVDQELDFDRLWQFEPSRPSAFGWEEHH